MTEKELVTPCYIVDADRLEENLKILHSVISDTGCRILLAQKAFSCFALYQLVAQYLDGATASGIFEARLCSEEMPGKENHIFNPAFREEDFDEILRLCDHIVFNSANQLRKFGKRAKDAGLQVGIRVNPLISTQPESHSKYDPCVPGSRFGVTEKEFFSMSEDEIALLDGIHFHTLCEQNSDDLKVTLDEVEKQFGKIFPRLKWLNFGGGHHITRDDYDIELLKACILRIREKYGLAVYLEPGEAIALNAGYLHTKVLEVIDREGETPIAIVDASATCHMPDVIEMPYRPPLEGSGMPGEKEFDYVLGCPTCLTGDIIGTYSFDKPLKEGDTLVFEDMAIYSMVKNNTFNGMPLPAIYLKRGEEYSLQKEFSYKDFKDRLS